MKKFLIVFFFLLVGLISPVFVSANHFSLDRNFSPHSSSNNFLALQEIAFSFQNRLPYDKGSLPESFEFLDFLDYYSLYHHSALSDWKSEGIPKMGLRAAELGFIWQPINLMSIVTQHEVFGHGYRVRDLGSNVAGVEKYTLSFKFSWTGLVLENAATHICSKRFFSPTESLAIHIAGMEANLIFGHNIVMAWLQKGEIDGRQASLWRKAHFDTANYLGTIKKLNGFQVFALGEVSGHDIANYLRFLNQIYTPAESMDKQLQNLRFKAIMSRICNPMTYLSYCSEIAYILFHSSLPIPGIKIQEMLVLPAYNFALTPFGPEDIFEVYIWNEGVSPSYIYFKTFDHVWDKYFGLGFENRGLFNLKWGTIGLKINLWVQPQMLLEPMYYDIEYYAFLKRSGFSDECWVIPANDKESFGKTVGGSSSIVYSYQLINNLSNINLEVGYKTQGYLPGESLLRSPIAKLGLLVQF